MNFEPRQRKLRDLVKDFSSGAILLPQFQRDYVWPVNKIRNLLDSLLRGFPIGAFYLWEPSPDTSIDPKQKAFRANKRFSAEPHSYLIDGQQRLTGLEGAFGFYSGEDKRGEELRCYLDLAASDGPKARDTRLFVSYSGNQKIADRADRADSALVAVSRLFDLSDHVARNDSRREIEQNLTTLNWEHPRRERALRLFDRACVMLDQLVPCTVITDATDEEAVEIFSRLNKGGKQLSQSDVKAAELARGRAVDVLKRMRSFVSGDMPTRLGFGFSFAFRALVLFHQGSAQFKSLKPDWVNATGAYNRSLAKSWEATEKALIRALRFVDEIGWCRRALVPSAIAIIVFAAALDKDGLELSERDRQLYTRWLCLTALRNAFQSSVETTINKYYRSIRESRSSAASALVEVLKRDGRKIRADDLCVSAQLWGPATQVMHAWLVSRKAKDWLNERTIDELARSGSAGLPGGDLTVHHIFPRGFLKGVRDADQANRPANYALISRETNSNFKDAPPEEVLARLTPEQQRLAQVQHFSLEAGDRLKRPEYDEFCLWRARRIADSMNDWLGLE